VTASCEHSNEPYGFDTRWGISRLDKRLSASEEGLCTMELHVKRRSLILNMLLKILHKGL
jgi:hypothetical protein